MRHGEAEAQPPVSWRPQSLPLPPAPPVWSMVLLGILAATFFGSLAWYGLNIAEEGATVHLFFRVAQGERPYFDFISGYAPAYFYFHAALLLLLGESIVPLRLVLAAVHTGNVLLLYRLAGSVLPARWAVLPALGYMASLPVVESSECSFNVPYPAWYALLFSLLGVLVARSAARGAALRWSIAAGALAGLAFSFKPNSGLFLLAFSVLALALLGGPPPGRGAVRAAVVVSVLAGVVVVLRHHWAAREIAVFFLPLLLSILALARAQGARLAQGEANPWAVFAPLGGFLVITAPWLIWAWSQLGSARFLHDVLFVGTGYERFFFEPYRASLLDLGAALLMGALLWWLPTRAAVAPKWRPLGWLLLGGAVVTGLELMGRATMPEGPLVALTSAAQRGAFLLVPVAHTLSGVWLWLARPSGSFVSLALLVLAAQTYWLNAYPRSDYFHVAYSAPLSWVLVVWLGRELGRRWADVFFPHWQRALAAASWLATVSLLVLLALPQVRLVTSVVAASFGWPSGLQWLPVERAQILVQEGPAGTRQRTLAEVVSYLRGRTQRGEWLFTFPDLELVTFLSGLRSPARIGYFKAGWPAHGVEAEVVDALEVSAPRWVVSEDPASLFFFDSPTYFFLLSDWVRRHYREHARFGSFVLFERAEEGSIRAGPASGPFLPPLATRLPATCDRDALAELRQTRDAAAALAWAQAWVSGGRLSWQEPCAKFALRILGEVGGGQVARLVFSGPPAVGKLEEEWRGALWNLALRGILRPAHWGGNHASAEQRQAWRELREDEREQLSSWLEPWQPPQYRLFAAWALARSGQSESLSLPKGEDVAAIVARAVMITERRGAAEAWVEILLQEPALPNLIPALFLQWAERDREQGWGVMRRVWPEANAEIRSTLAYLTAVLAAPESCSWLAEQERGEPEATVRHALGWSRRQLSRRGICTHQAVSG